MTLGKSFIFSGPSVSLSVLYKIKRHIWLGCCRDDKRELSCFSLGSQGSKSFVGICELGNRRSKGHGIQAKKEKKSTSTCQWSVIISA